MKKNIVHMIRSETNVQMMSFIIETSAGGYILIDGGFEDDGEDLLKYMQKVTGQEKPHMDAVWLTHPHTDHVKAFNYLVRERFDSWSFDHVYFNFASTQFLKRDPDPDHTTMFYSLLPKFADKIVIVSGGDVYEIAGAKFEVLYTTDFEFQHNVCNNSSTVFRVTLGSKTIMFLGDLGVEAGEKLARLYGQSLKSDYVQMAHHGQNGVDRPVYELIHPQDGCFWTTPKWLWDNDAGKGYNTHSWKTIIVRGWMDEIVPNRKDYIMMNGTQVVEIE